MARTKPVKKPPQKKLTVKKVRQASSSGKPRGRRSSWDKVAEWYDGWVGKKGSHYHRTVAIPTVLELLTLKKGEHILDVGSGQGVLAPHVLKAGAHYTGVELSPRLLQLAREHHPKAEFIQADARTMAEHQKLTHAHFDAAVFMLSIQDMDPLDDILAATTALLKPRGRLIIFMIHPCFRMPRQSGWGYDPGRKLTYRRIDSYLTPRRVPMKENQQGATFSFHRPLSDYVRVLSQSGLYINQLTELPDNPLRKGEPTPDNQEIPLFMALRAMRHPSNA
jgi:ubiquinone/menaquinone biosynthesis C-methylase UbiE